MFGVVLSDSVKLAESPLGRLKLIVCFASGFFKNPMHECENKTHSMKNYTEFLWSKDKAKVTVFLWEIVVCFFFGQDKENPTRGLTQNIQSNLNGLM